MTNDEIKSVVMEIGVLAVNNSGADEDKAIDRAIEIARGLLALQLSRIVAALEARSERCKQRARDYDGVGWNASADALERSAERLKRGKLP